MLESKNNTKEVAAIFDLDGTLFAGHLWIGLVRHHLKHKLKRFSVYAYVVSHMPLWLAGKLKLIKEETYKRIWGQNMPFLLKGLEKDKVVEIYKWITDYYLMPLLHTDILNLVESHKKRGHTTILLSGSFDDFLQVVREKLGIDFAVGTKLEVKNNVYSGRIIKPMGFGINKVKLLKDLISEANLDLDLGKSFAYADSISDAPMLEITGNPTATYPDAKLLNLAKQRSWQILPATLCLD
jgi:HAD superfamily hydrolase (TIGR01490 family)